MNEQDVLAKLNAKDWRSISKDNILGFASSLENLPAEIQAKVIEQFPAFADLAEAISNQYFSLVQDYLKDSELLKIQVASHQKVLDTYKERIDLLGADMSSDDFAMIMLDMKEEADKISAAVERHQERKREIIETTGKVAGFAIAVPGALIGVVKFVARR